MSLMPIESEYSREIKKNEGFSSISMAANLVSVFMGILCVLSYGDHAIVNNTMKVASAGIFFGILALIDRKQKLKHYAWISIVMCSGILLTAIIARLTGWIN